MAISETETVFFNFFCNRLTAMPWREFLALFVNDVIGLFDGIAVPPSARVRPLTLQSKLWIKAFCSVSSRLGWVNDQHDRTKHAFDNALRKLGVENHGDIQWGTVAQVLQQMMEGPSPGEQVGPCPLELLPSFIKSSDVFFCWHGSMAWLFCEYQYCQYQYQCLFVAHRGVCGFVH